MRMTDEGEPSPGEGFRLRVTNEGWYCVILCIRIVCGIIYTRTVGDAGPYGFVMCGIICAGDS